MDGQTKNTDGWKRDYLVKTLSRTKRKDYENYVVGAIWHKLGNNNIKPVTQQYVKRNDEKYAYIDLYFPQINLGVECDEEYHKLNKLADEERAQRLEVQLTALYEDKFELCRVDFGKDQTLESIDKQINEIVELIKKKYTEIGSPMWTEDDSVEIALGNDILKVSDRLYFRTIVDVAKIFGKEYTSYQRATFPLDDNNHVWFPKLVYKDASGEDRAGSKDWTNVLSPDWNTITEKHTGEMRKDPAKYKQSRIKRLDWNMIAFGRSINCIGQAEYSFLGVYKMGKTDARSKITIYEKISDEINLQEFRSRNKK